MRFSLLLICCFLLSVTLVPSVLAQNEQAYISDDLTVFLHTGPSRQYRIIGTVISGTEVDVLARSESGDFSQIRDPEGRTAWLESQYLQSDTSIKALLPQVQKRLEDTEAQIPSLQAKIAELTTSLNESVQGQSEQAKALQEAQAYVLELEDKLNTKELDIQIKWLINGGGLALGSIILGILISYLPKRRKRNDGWTN